MKTKQVCKTSIIVGLFLTLVLTVTGQNNLRDTIADQYSDLLPKKLNFSVSNDSLNVVVKIVEYSNSIIQYELTIKTHAIGDAIKQKGFAINPHTKVNGDIIYGKNEKGEGTGFHEYYSYYCSCEEDLIFNFTISTDKRLMMIFSSRQAKFDLLNDESILQGGDPRESVNLFGFIYRKEQ